jgi:hypothetical protein
MSPKGVYPHTHIKPREYPAEIIDGLSPKFVEWLMALPEAGSPTSPALHATTS